MVGCSSHCDKFLCHRLERAAACRPWGAGIVWQPPAQLIMPPPYRWRHKTMMLLTSVCLSRTSGLSRESERSRKTKIGNSPTSRTFDSDITLSFQGQKVVKWSRLPGRFTHRRVNASGSCNGERGNVRISRGKLLLCCGALGGARRFGANRGRRGHIVAAARPRSRRHQVAAASHILSSRSQSYLCD